MKAILDLPEAHARALETVLARIPPADVLWALTGSAGLRLQGVDIPVHDLDLQSDRLGVYEMERRLDGFIRTPVHLWESENVRSWDGKAEIAGVEVELIGDMAHRNPDGAWGAPPDIAMRIFVTWRDQRVPVLPLAYEAGAYVKMGRAEKAARIRAVLDARRN
ncbi:MAG: hypothetical protein GXP40_00045 [Chloroflexi bacterium]|nr:hypothetical protein [Chloroflexota bacterium]